MIWFIVWIFLFAITTSLNAFVGALFFIFSIIIWSLTGGRIVSEGLVNDVLVIHSPHTGIGDEIQLIASREVAKTIKPNVPFGEAWEAEDGREEYTLNAYTRRHQNDGYVKIFCRVIG